MTDGISWQDFCLLYYDVAMKHAEYHLAKVKAQFSNWDSRIDEEAVKVDVVMDALQKAYTKYNPSRGTTMNTFLSTVVHNGMVDEIGREMKSLSAVRDLTARQEADLSVGSIVSQIPEMEKLHLLDKMYSALRQLSPIDQTIISLYLDDPKTFMDKAVEKLNVSCNYVSVHKNRAIARLPELMGVSRDDYHELLEECYYLRSTTMDSVDGSNTLHRARPGYRNPIDPEFSLEDTAMKLLSAYMSATKKTDN